MEEQNEYKEAESDLLHIDYRTCSCSECQEKRKSFKIDDQVALLKKRGVNFDNEEKARDIIRCRLL